MSKQLQDPGEALAFAKASAQGYSHGIAAARRVSAAESEKAALVREQLLASIEERGHEQDAQVRALAARLNAAQLPVVDDAANRVLAAAFAIAESIIGIALSDAQMRALSITVRSGAQDGRQLVELHVSPADAVALRAMNLEVAIVEDRSLNAGDFKATYGDGWLDGVLGGAIDRARVEAERQVHAL